MNRVHSYMWDIIVQPCHNFNGGFAKPPLKLRRGWVITSHRFTWFWFFVDHNNSVIMSVMASQITSLAIVYSTVCSAQIKENIKSPCHRPLCGEFTGDRWIPRTKGQLRGNASIRWRHHGYSLESLISGLVCSHRQKHIWCQLEKLLYII